MTTDFAQTYSPSSVPIYGSGIDASTPEPPSPLHWRTFRLPKDDPDYAIAIGWEAKLDDLRGGYAQYGDFSRGGSQYDGDYRKTATSTLDQRFDRHLLLPPLIGTTTLGTAADGGFTSWCHFGTNRVLVMANGGATNFSLFTETSATNPAIAAVTYNPTGSIITNVSPIVQGSATAAEALAVCSSDAAIEILDTSFASVGTMHANTATCYGLLSSPINASTPGTLTHLIPATNTMYTLSSAVAVGTAPTAVLTGIPEGIRPLGIEQLQKNWPLRAFWFWPLQNGAKLNSRYPQSIKSTNLEGTDPQPVPMKIERIWGAVVWNQKIVAHGGPQVKSYDGQDTIDLHWDRNRASNTSFRWDCVNLFVWGEALYGIALRTDLTATSGAVGSSVAQVERYLPEFDSWVPVSGALPLAVGVESSNEAAPLGDYMLYYSQGDSLPVSLQSGYLHYTHRAPATTWQRLFIAPGNMNPFYHYNGAGGSNNIAQGFATTGTYDSPYFSLPTLEGRRKKADQIVFLGQIAEGNVKVTINPNEGGTAVTFAGTDTTRTQPVEASDADFDLMQVRIQLNQGATTTRTPNGLPIVIRGRAYLNAEDDIDVGIPALGGF